MPETIERMWHTKPGEVFGEIAQRHTSAEFVAFLTDTLANQPKGKEINFIREIFASVADPKRKRRRYIRHYSNQPKPVKWKYLDTSRRSTLDSIVTVHQEPPSSA